MFSNFVVNVVISALVIIFIHTRANLINFPRFKYDNNAALVPSIIYESLGAQILSTEILEGI